MPTARASGLAMLSCRPKNWFALCAAVMATVQPACSTKAVGVEECRRIEYARCEAAAHCPGQFEIQDVEQCRLFYRDHCLHGLPLSSPPTATAVKACVNAVQQLSECASDGGPSASVAECGVESTKPKLSTVCKLLTEPEAVTACGFLVGDTTSMGGQAGSAGQPVVRSEAAGGASADTNGAGSVSGADPQGSGVGGLADLFGFGGLAF